MELEMSTLSLGLKAASQPHSLGWEDTAIPKRAAVANDAIPRFTDEPWA